MFMLSFHWNYKKAGNQKFENLHCGKNLNEKCFTAQCEIQAILRVWFQTITIKQVIIFFFFAGGGPDLICKKATSVKHNKMGYSCSWAEPGEKAVLHFTYYIVYCIYASLSFPCAFSLAFSNLIFFLSLLLN